jgi:hypothetical protein
VSRRGGDPGWLVLPALAAGILLVCASAEVVAQTDVQVRPSAKTVSEDPRSALLRLTDAWTEAVRDAGPAARPEAVADALVTMMQQPIKSVGLQELDIERQRQLKEVMMRGSGRIRAVASALSRGAIGEPETRAAVQEAVDEYLVLVRPLFEDDTAPLLPARPR